MTTLTRTEIRTMLEHGDPNYIRHCAKTYYKANIQEVKEDMIRRVASHCDIIARYEHPLDPNVKTAIAHFLQAETETL